MSQSFSYTLSIMSWVKQKEFMVFVDPVDSCSSSNSYLHIVLLEVQNFYEILIFLVGSLKRAKFVLQSKLSNSVTYKRASHMRFSKMLQLSSKKFISEPWKCFYTISCIHPFTHTHRLMKNFLYCTFIYVCTYDLINGFIFHSAIKRLGNRGWLKKKLGTTEFFFYRNTIKEEESMEQCERETLVFTTKREHRHMLHWI